MTLDERVKKLLQSFPVPVPVLTEPILATAIAAGRGANLMDICSADQKAAICDAAGIEK